MTSLVRKFYKTPIFYLLIINILIGTFTFFHYGLSWDEPLFYEYADSLGYAYSPQEWFSNDFDLENSYGPSAEDHKTRGPAYLLLARGFVYVLRAIGSDEASAWHLINFLFFQLGVYFLYRLASRWVRPSAAFAASAFFCYQPLLWGHAFINPKDPSFLIFFTGAICMGFEMVDALAEKNPAFHFKLIVAACFLGIATSIRVLGPLAGILVLVYSIATLRKKFTAHLPQLTLYVLSTILISISMWPFLWEDPIGRFFEVVRFMSDNPTQLAVLFNGEIFRADNMPRRYLPFMLGTTLTEPTWLLFILGIGICIRKYFKKAMTMHGFIAILLTISWFVIPAGYVLVQQPAMYDGLRHFLFLLPPVFIISGFAFEYFGEVIKAMSWLRAGLVFLLLFPGLYGIVQLHPYEYTYYNSFIGGTSGAFRRYETDFWLTCYKEAVQKLDQQIDKPINLYVRREAYIAAYYATENIAVKELRGALDEVQSRDYVLVNTRTNEDRSTFRDSPPVLQINRGGATFCIVKEIP